jgi:MFS family permease
MAKDKGWFNSTVLGAGLTSFLSDMSHEVVTVLLPSFMLMLGAPVYALGLIEGVSDGLSSFSKLFSGYYADKIGHRKEISAIGYFVTGIFPLIVAFATTWPIVLVARALGWLGRGIRGPPRDAILAESVEKKSLGKAFGFHRAADTLGAIAGPLLAYFLLAYMGMREIFAFAVIPGMLAVVAFWFLIKDKNPDRRDPKRTLRSSLGGLPSEFKKFLAAVGVFGASDFSHTLLIFYCVSALTPSIGLVQASATGVALYLVRNVVYALASFPFGALGDAWGRRKVLVAGYAIGALTFLGFALVPPSVLAFAILFALAGAYIAAQDALEGALAGEMVPEKGRATAFGALASVNGVGDMLSSAIVGILWTTVGFTAGFAYATALATIGTIVLAMGIRKSTGSTISTG